MFGENGDKVSAIRLPPSYSRGRLAVFTTDTAIHRRRFRLFLQAGISRRPNGPQHPLNDRFYRLFRLYRF